MELTKSEIVKKVRLLLNENTPNEGDFDSGNDNTDLEATIEDRILEALQFINSNALAEMLVPDKVITGYEVEEVNGITVGKMYLPSTFMRLVSATAQGWTSTVETAVSSTSPEWKSLFDPYVSGGLDNPKVGIRRALITEINSNTNDTLSIGSFVAFLVCVILNMDDEDERPWAELNYMELPSWKKELEPASTKEEWIEVSPLVVDAFYYYLTGLVLSTLNDDRSQGMVSQALALIGVQQQQEG